MKAFRIDLPYACYTIVLDGIDPYATVKRAPPIAGWMIGRFLRDIEDWVIRKHGTITMTGDL